MSFFLIYKDHSVFFIWNGQESTTSTVLPQHYANFPAVINSFVITYISQSLRVRNLETQLNPLIGSHKAAIKAFAILHYHLEVQMRKNLLLSSLTLLEAFISLWLVKELRTLTACYLLETSSRSKKLPTVSCHMDFPNMIKYFVNQQSQSLTKSPSKTESCITKGNLRIAFHHPCYNWWFEASHGSQHSQWDESRAWIPGSHQGQHLSLPPKQSTGILIIFTFHKTSH